MGAWVRSFFIVVPVFARMRTVRCRACGARVRRDRLDSHMRAAHRKGRELRVWPLALTIAFMVTVTLAALLYIRGPAATDEEGAGPVDPDAAAIQFNSADGWVIKGTYHRGNQSMPVVILVPGVGEGRAAYGPLVDELHAKGYNVLAYDPRGCGESVYQNGRNRVWQDFTDADFQGGINDITKAQQYALSYYPSAPKVAVVGASLGANQALASAASESPPELKALVLLAPGPEYRGIASRPAIEALNNLTSRPAILFAASQGDPASAGPVAQSLNQTYAGVKQLAILSGSRHGTQLLTDPTFRNQVADFLADAF